MKGQKIYFYILLAFLFFFSTLAQQSSTPNSLSGTYVPKKSKTQYSTIAGFIIGPVLFILSFVGVWYNEKRAAVNYKRLKLSEKLLDENNHPAQYDLDNLNTSLNSKKTLMHRTGIPQIIQAARDEQCQVFLSDALSIIRKVEVKEVRSYSKRRSNQQEIEYKLEWVSQNIQQCEVESNSPLRWFIKNEKFYAPEVKLCGYFLNQSQIKQLQCDSVISPNQETIVLISYLASKIGGPWSQPIVFNDYIYFPAQKGDVQSKGSLRVKFFYCKNTQLSIICSLDQHNQGYQPFRIDLVDNNGQQDSTPCEDAQCCICCGKLAQMLKPMSELNLIVKGNYDSHQMIDMSVKKNGQQTLLLRILFFVLMVLGIWIFFSPFVQVLGYLPLVGGFLKAVTGIFIFIGAFLVSIPLFSITFGLAWLRYHPVIGGSALGIAAGIIILFSII